MLPAGARPFNVTVPSDTLPPMTAVGLSVTPEIASAIPGVTVKDAVSVAPL
jgi:hypothetical protein